MNQVNIQLRVINTMISILMFSLCNSHDFKCSICDTHVSLVDGHSSVDRD